MARRQKQLRGKARISSVDLEAWQQRVTAGSLTGFALDEVEVTKSQEFDSMCPGRELPKFFWLQIVGLASKDDFGLAPDHRLVVSEKALEQLSRFGLNFALVEAFDAP